MHDVKSLTVSRTLWSKDKDLWSDDKTCKLVVEDPREQALTLTLTSTVLMCCSERQHGLVDGGQSDARRGVSMAGTPAMSFRCRHCPTAQDVAH